MRHLIVTDNLNFSIQMQRSISAYVDNRKIEILEFDDMWESRLYEKLFRTSEECTHLIIDAELKGFSAFYRQRVIGLDVATYCRTALTIGFKGPITVVGFSQTNYITSRVNGNIINRDKYGIEYIALPINTNKIKELVNATAQRGANEKSVTEEQSHRLLQQIGQTYLIGLIDDEFELTVEGFSNALRDKSSRFHFVSFSYKNSISFEENLTILEKWLRISDFFDLLLVDMMFPTGQDKGGVHILDMLSKMAFSVPTMIISATEDKDAIRQSLVDYQSIVEDYLPIKTKGKNHNRIDVENYHELTVTIGNCLTKSGSRRNKIGILITHGTDTMAWTLGLLRYALKNPRCNVVLTGSQIPLESEYSPSDAAANIESSLYFINQLVPPQIGVVFNRGAKLLSSNLRKVRIWDINAFEGDIIASFNWEEISPIDKVLRFDNTLDVLYLLTTGGTIGMESVGGLKTISDNNPLGKFFQSDASMYRKSLEETGAFYKELKLKDVFQRDSSEVSIPEYTKLLHQLQAIQFETKSQNGIGICDEIDLLFRWDVIPILCSPLFTEQDYKDILGLDSGIMNGLVKKKKTPSIFVLLGFGAGNAPRDSVLKPIELLIRLGHVVVLSSQVPIETPDLEYEVSNDFISAGVIPGGDMSFPELCMKGAYILGHYDQGKDDLNYLKSALLSGVNFRSLKSKRKYIQKIHNLGQNHSLPPQNYFNYMTYEKARNEVLKFTSRLSK